MTPILYYTTITSSNNNRNNIRIRQKAFYTITVFNIKRLKQLTVLTHIDLSVSQRTIYIHY